MLIIADILVLGGACWVLACCLFLLRTNNSLDRLHYVSCATMIGPWPIALAVVLDGGGQGGAGPWMSALLVALIFTLAGPTITYISAHAPARAEQPRKAEEVAR